MQFTRRDLAYTIYARLEESIRSWVRNVLLNSFGSDWRDYIPNGVWSKGLERLGLENRDEVDDPMALLEESDLPDLAEIACYRTGYSQFVTTDLSADEFRLLMQRLYDIRIKIAHIKSSFSIFDLDALLDIVKQFIPALGSAVAPIRDTVEYIQTRPEKVVIRMPESMFLVEPERTFTYTNNVPSADYDSDGGFIGRKDDLKKVNELVLGGLHRVVTISGAGGVGKTALAHRFCQDLLRRSDFPFDGVVWVSAKEDKLTLTGIMDVQPSLGNYEDLLNSILETFGWGDSLTKSLAEKEEDVQTILRAGKRGILLVVDNLETIRDQNVIEFLKDFPPPSRVLITSRLGLGEVERRYQLKEMSTKDAVVLLRTVAREKGADGLATLPEDILSAYVEKMARYPLAIKWVIGQVALGKDINLVLRELTSSTGDVAKFCFEHIFEHLLPQDAQMILYSLASNDRPLVRGVLAHVSNLSTERLDEGLKILTIASLVVLDYRKAVDGGIETVYTLLPLTRNYLRSRLHANPDVQNDIRTRVEMVENLIEESERVGRHYTYSLHNMGAQTEEEKIAAMWALTGYQKYQAGDYDGSIQSFKRAQQIAPNFPAVYRNWATVESQAGYDAKADELMRLAVKLAPRDAGLWFVWGNMERRRRHYDRAFEYLTKAREIRPNDVPIIGALAEVEKCRGRFQNAADLLLQALQDRSLNTEVSWSKHEAICYTSLADTYKRWAEAFARDRQWRESLDKLRQGYLYGNRGVQASPDDERAKDTFRQVSLDLGIQLLHDEGLETAKPYLLQVIEEGSGRRWKNIRSTVTACYYLAKELLELGHVDEARKYYSLGRKNISPSSTLAGKYRELEQALNAERKRGRLFHVVPDKGYGYLEVDGDVGQSVYLHRNDVGSGVSVREFEALKGVEFVFVLATTPKGPKAVNARMVSN